MNFEGLRDDVLRMIAGEAVPVNTGIFTNDMITFRIKDDVLTLLIHLGYHYAEKTVFIPNNDIRLKFICAFLDIYVKASLKIQYRKEESI